MITFSTRPGHIDEPLHQSLKKFPAGEVDMALTADAAYAFVQFLPDTLHEDLMYLQMWSKVRQGKKKVLQLPYVPGARADRDMHGARVYCDLINSLECDQVVICDPHSPVVVEYLNNVMTVDNVDIFSTNTYDPRADGFTGIIAPDKGAIGRAHDIAEWCFLPVYTANKTRDFETGKFTGYTAPTGIDLENGKYLVVDDICDGGGTFALLAQSLGLAKEQLGLYVTHGIFSGRAVENLASYGTIITTNSFSGRSDDLHKAGYDITVFDVTTAMNRYSI